MPAPSQWVLGAWGPAPVKGGGWKEHRRRDLGRRGHSSWGQGEDQRNDGSQPCPPRERPWLWTGQASTPAASHHITQVPSGGQGLVGEHGSVRRGGRGTTALLVGLQSAVELLCSLNLPRSLGGGDCHPWFKMGKGGSGHPGWAGPLDIWFLGSCLKVRDLSTLPGSPGWEGAWLDGAHHSAVWRPLRPEAAGGKY